MTDDPAVAAALARAEAAEARAAAALAQAEAAEARAAALEAAAAAAGSGRPVPDVAEEAGSAPADDDAPAPAPDDDDVPAPAADDDVPAAAPDDDAPAAAPDGDDAPGAGGGGALTPHAVAVRDAYADVLTRGAAVPLGALVVDGEATPRAAVGLPLATVNRHGLVAGATGTGKTRTLQLMAEGLSRAGVPVFLADIKGDLSGLAVPGTASERLTARTGDLAQAWAPSSFPVEAYTLGGMGTGVPIRTTVTDFGPLLLAKVLGLNATQESSLGLVFHWADAQGLALLDLADLRAVVGHLVSDAGRAELKGIGGLSSATAGVILREIVALQAQGADAFFGEPAFDTADLLRTVTTPDGVRGVVSALQLPGVQDRPALFSTFLMWLLADLFSTLPEVGDVERPRLVFFFDEAHLLFTGASKDFLAQVTQTVRLIRSKGVGVFFVTQTPKDVPRDVLAQLGNRVQHALRAHTPDDATALRATARTFPRSGYDVEEVLTTLATGEALVTVLSEEGAPTPVAWTRLYAPTASMEPAAPGVLEALVAASPGQVRYGTPVDRESARELLAERAEREAREAAEREAAERRAEEAEDLARELEREVERERRAAEKEAERAAARARRDAERAARRVSDPFDALLRSAGSTLGREITRTILGTRRRR